MEMETLKQLMKESIREVLREERLSLMQVLIPDVSDQEMKEIIKKFDSPDKYDKEDVSERRKALISNLQGKYAHAPTSSEDFAQQKQNKLFMI